MLIRVYADGYFIAGALIAKKVASVSALPAKTQLLLVAIYYYSAVAVRFPGVVPIRAAEV